MSDVASSVGMEPVSAVARLVTGVGMEEKHSGRRRRRMAVIVVVGASVEAAGVGWQKVVEDQPGPCPFPACKDHLQLGLCGGHRSQFGPGRMSCRERKMPAPGSGRRSSHGCTGSGMQGWATSP